MESVMNRVLSVATAAMLAAGLLGPQAFAQGKPQTVAITRVDPQSLATGFRVSKVVGSTVVNEANQTVGTVDDLIVTPNEKVPFAVLSVGGFLGMGTKYVVVPYSSLQLSSNHMMLPGATKDSLKSLPDFKYAS
jgi:sporulation protein YlmC with PRC-barrel domain